MFMVAMVLALVGYAVFPTAPPRMFGELGFTDTISTFTGIEQDTSSASFLVNPYAAVPSMHIAFSLMLAAPAVALVSSSAARAVWSAYPLFVFFVVIVTANHYWFDAAVGAAVACTATIAAHQLARLRPEHWSWRGATAKRSPRDGGDAKEHGASCPLRSGPARLRARPPDRVAADAERDLDDRARAESGRGRAGAGASTSCSAGWRSSSARSWTRSTGATRGCPARARLFGAFLDSTLDRIEEGIVLAAVAYYFAEHGDSVAAAACVVTVLGSLMVSYTRARAEALGVECKVGAGDPPGAGSDPLDRARVRRRAS